MTAPEAARVKARLATIAGAIVLLGSNVAYPHTSQTILPSGWILRAPVGRTIQTGTMPQGAAASADGSMLAVVESGFNPPALDIYATRDLHLIRRVGLRDAFGRPVWTRSGILVAGETADAVFAIDPRSGAVRLFPVGKNTRPVSVAAKGDLVAVATDNDGCVRFGTLGSLNHARAIRVGAQPGNLAFSTDGKKLFVAIRSASSVAAIDLQSKAVRYIATDLHPADLLVEGDRLYVAQSDADTLGVYDAQTGKRVRDVFVGTLPYAIGSSPNALARRGDSTYVSLGAANEIAVVRNGAVVARLSAGWYPTDVVPLNDRVLVIDGKGEGTKPNPDFDVMSKGYRDYVAAIEYGSIRVVPISGVAVPSNPQGQAGFRASPPGRTIVRANGPIEHVFFILKENRTYDQILGDIGAGNSDAKLVWFGERVTPNQHALARRFGIFDNFYTNGEVSDSGHNWADEAFANDYVERYWPPAYRALSYNDHVMDSAGAHVPGNGYMWEAARRAHVTFRDYGEMAQLPGDSAPVTARGLENAFDPKYVSWNLDYSDVNREKEWQREFERFVRAGTLPQLEYIWLPNDHTYGSRAGKRTPAALIGQNDYAVGLLVAAISHSKVWKSSVIFITEDDAQDGADHVSDQRSTLYVASPYARGGVIHAHYSTVSVLRTIELFLGMRPLTAYDASAVPLYSAFRTAPKSAPFDAVPPKIDLNARNAKTAYGQRISARANFKRPDAVPPETLTDIIAHNRSARVAGGAQQ
jgi:DNA-binding beta-propeller fold protein YncE